MSFIHPHSEEMRFRCKILIGFFVIFLWGTLAFSQQNDSLQSNNYTERKFPNDLIDKYSSEDFNYEWVEPELPKQIQMPTQSSFNFIKYLVISFVVFIFGYLIYLIFSGKSLMLFTKKPVALTYTKEITEKADGIEDFESLILTSESIGDYQTATRYRFLKYLFELQKRSAITIHKEKTNAEYASEIKNTMEKRRFLRLSNIYEAVWYGKHPVTNDIYHSIVHSFTLK